MHTAVMHTGTVVFLDRTNIGPSHIKLANGACRNSSTDLVRRLNLDNYLHDLIYQIPAYNVKIYAFWDWIHHLSPSDMEDDDAILWHVTWSKLIGDHCVTEYVIRYQKLTATRIQWNLRQGRTRCAPWPLKPTPGAAPVPSYLMALSCKLGATSTVLSKFVTSNLVLQVWSLTT